MPDATIRDVARRAQVSVASVSRALNNLDNVSDDHAKLIGAYFSHEYSYAAAAVTLSRARDTCTNSTDGVGWPR